LIKKRLINIITITFFFEQKTEVKIAHYLYYDLYWEVKFFAMWMLFCSIGFIIVFILFYFILFFDTIAYFNNFFIFLHAIRDTNIKISLL
jgi:hypothetical protein